MKRRMPVEPFPWEITQKGTDEQPCFLVRDPFQDEGMSIKHYLDSFLDGKGIPADFRTKRWMSWTQDNQHSYHQFHSLDGAADEILAELSTRFPNTAHLKAPGKGYSSKDINVYSEGGTGVHQDAQEYGRLLFIFCAGNNADFSVWLGQPGKVAKDRQSTEEKLSAQGYNQKKFQLKSGDVLVLEGKTWHKAHTCQPRTSPKVMNGTWLENKRLSILVRRKLP